MGKEKWRFVVLACCLVTMFAFGALAFALGARFNQSNVRFQQAQATRAAQTQFNKRIDHAADRLTCAFIKLVKQGPQDLRNPHSPAYQLYIKLDFTPSQIATIADYAEKQQAKTISVLPPANCRQT